MKTLMNIITEETIEEYSKRIIKDSCGLITDPLNQAVVLSTIDLISYLEEEYDVEIEDQEDLAEIQEMATEYSGMDTVGMMINDTVYFVGNAEDLDDSELLGYAAWVAEDWR